MKTDNPGASATQFIKDFRMMKLKSLWNEISR